MDMPEPVCPRETRHETEERLTRLVDTMMTQQVALAVALRDLEARLATQHRETQACLTRIETTLDAITHFLERGRWP